MSLAVAKDIRDNIREKIWTKADELGWRGLSDIERAAWYENWSKDKEIGGVLSHFMDARKVRVYIKDSLVKPYLKNRLENNSNNILFAAGVNGEKICVKNIFEKPCGRELADGKIICWGNSRDWKSVVISVFERAHRLESGIPHAAILIETGRTTNPGVREMITEVGSRLGLDRVTWVDY